MSEDLIVQIRSLEKEIKIKKHYLEYLVEKLGDEFKVCSRCERAKERSKFGKQQSSADGLRPYCIKCVQLFNQEAHQRRKERLKKIKQNDTNDE